MAEGYEAAQPRFAGQDRGTDAPRTQLGLSVAMRSGRTGVVGDRTLPGGLAGDHVCGVWAYIACSLSCTRGCERPYRLVKFRIAACAVVRSIIARALAAQRVFFSWLKTQCSPGGAVSTAASGLERLFSVIHEALCETFTSRVCGLCLPWGRAGRHCSRGRQNSASPARAVLPRYRRRASAAVRTSALPFHQTFRTAFALRVCAVGLSVLKRTVGSSLATLRPGRHVSATRAWDGARAVAHALVSATSLERSLIHLRLPQVPQHVEQQTHVHARVYSCGR